MYFQNVQCEFDKMFNMHSKKCLMCICKMFHLYLKNVQHVYKNNVECAFEKCSTCIRIRMFNICLKNVQLVSEKCAHVCFQFSTCSEKVEMYLKQ